MNEYVVVKLSTGEQLMAVLLNETDSGIVIHDPIALKLIHFNKDGVILEQTVTDIFCSLTEEREYSIDRKDIMFYKPLHKHLIPYYRNLQNRLSKEYQTERSSYQEYSSELDLEDNLEEEKKESKENKYFH